ncbi:hypothetical protein [uncultured Roseobacter sp.]|uniref:hypothetical protein n=1 Tax=uncultured Roseobacter sp. TaxID=114847 RepID=UPI00261674D8|nr:hypothetical protein [uncultured Roseobacter sp.]
MNVPFPPPVQQALSHDLQRLFDATGATVSGAETLPADLLSRLNRIASLAGQTILPRAFEISSGAQKPTQIIAASGMLMSISDVATGDMPSALVAALSRPGILELTCLGRPAETVPVTGGIPAADISTLPLRIMSREKLLFACLKPVASAVFCWGDDAAAPSGPQNEVLAQVAQAFRARSRGGSPRGIIVPDDNRDATVLHGTAQAGFAVRAPQTAALKALQAWQQLA